MPNTRIPKLYQPLARLARTSGWTITQTRNQHLAWTAPSGAVVFTGSSPKRDDRCLRNSAAVLRRAGLETWRVGLGRRPKRRTPGSSAA